MAYTPPHEHTRIEERTRYGRLEARVSLAGNAALFTAKLLLGCQVLSMAIMGDALNHLTDVAVSAVMLWAFWITARGPDRDHPYGHGRAEPIAGVVVSTLIISMGAFVTYEGAMTLSAPMIRPDMLAVGLMLCFSVVKGAMAIYAFSIGKKIESTAVRADAWNHLSDVLISLTVAAGIFATQLSPHLRMLDPLMAVGIGIVIMAAGARLVHRSAREIMGRAPDAVLIRQIADACRSVPGVLDCHSIKVHEYGAAKEVSLHVTTSSALSASEAHRISEEVEQAVQHALKTRPIVHVDLAEDPCSDCVKEEIRRVAASFPQAVGVHNLSLTHGREGVMVHMHLVIDKDLTIERGHALVHEITTEVQKRFPRHRIEIHMEPCDGRCEECAGECRGSSPQP
ncbi:MAG: cation-efflux pump [Candidatus Thermoplasmatota archaeon]